jgi:hypothetical protein
MGELVGRGTDRDDDRQVVEQLKRRRGAVLFERIATNEATPPVGCRPRPEAVMGL